MSATPGTLCFTCGQPTSDPPRFNHLPSGRPCPACRDRLLEALPAILPGAPVAQEPEPLSEPARHPIRSTSGAARPWDEDGDEDGD